MVGGRGEELDELISASFFKQCRSRENDPSTWDLIRPAKVERRDFMNRSATAQ